MTALNLYGINTASVTLATADQLVTANGGATAAGTGTKIGTSTGFGEIWSQGTLNAWPAGGSIANPSGNGWLYDSTALEGQTIAAGVWTFILHLVNNGAGNVTADLWVRAFKRSSGGIFTAIVVASLLAQTIPTAASTFTITSGAAAAMAFATGDKLYHDVMPDITVGGSGASTKMNMARGSGATGASNFAEIDTPGYSPTATGHILIADGYGGVFS